LYRSNLFSSIFSSRQYIVHKKVFVNGVLVNKPGFRVKIDDIVSVSNPEFFYNDLKLRLLNNQVLGNFPSYLNVNYKLGLVKLIRIPSNKDVPFPFFMNIDTMVHNFTN
jgi:ribosomal protein S4